MEKTEIALTPDRAMASLMPLLMSTADERDLTDEQMSQVALIAKSSPPALPEATADELRQVVAFLAGSLQAPKSSTIAGRIKLGAYRIALQGQPMAALQFAVEKAIATREWLPAPAIVKQFADEFTNPELRAHARAQRLIRDRAQRLFEENLQRCKRKELSHDELQALCDHTARVAQTHGSIIILISGERVYRTKDTVLQDAKEREGIAKGQKDERDNRADAAPKRARAGRDVGALAAGVMAGLEVDDE